MTAATQRNETEKSVTPASEILFPSGTITTGALSWATKLTGPGAIRQALGITRTEMRDYINQTTGRAYSVRAVYNFEDYQSHKYVAADGSFHPKYRLAKDVVRAYVVALGAAVLSATGGRIGIQVKTRQSHWRVSFLAHCRRCGRMFVVTKSRQIRCKRCDR